MHSDVVSYSACVAELLSCVRLFVTPWTVAHQAPVSMGFPRQEHWSGVLCPPPADLPDTGIDPKPPMSPASTGGFFTTRPSGKPVTYFTLPSKMPLLFVAALLYWNSQVHALLTLSIYLFFFFASLMAKYPMVTYSIFF